MPDFEAALLHVDRHGRNLDQARLHYLLTGETPPHVVTLRWFAHQRPDGGFAPMWASQVSSIDATCYQLTQMSQLGLGEEHPIAAQALRFLAERQKADGLWEEQPELVDVAPPWAQPGHLAATCYLTANAGWVLSQFPGFSSCSERAITFLLTQLDATGGLPSFVNAHWIALALFHRAGLQDEATRLSAHVATRVPELSASDLAWLVDCLTVAGLNEEDVLLSRSAHRLGELQRPTGEWVDDPTEPGATDCTVQSLIALARLGEFENHPFFN